VSAGIGVIAVLSPMIQEIFGGMLVGQPGVLLDALSTEAKVRTAAIGAGFVGLISLFNIGGRFFWASVSDKIGRKATYAIFLLLGGIMYASIPWASGIGSQTLFVVFLCVIASMYGGGFATIPAYLADMFGTQFVGAIHGRLLTARSTAGILGPILFLQITQAQKDAKIPSNLVYDQAFYVMAGLMAVGFVANLLIRPVAERWYMPEGTTVNTVEAAGGSFGIGRGGLTAPALLAWACVGLPLAWGIYIALSKAVVLFR
jgi:MFS family permease